MIFHFEKKFQQGGFSAPVMRPKPTVTAGAEKIQVFSGKYLGNRRIAKIGILYHSFYLCRNAAGFTDGKEAVPVIEQEKGILRAAAHIGDHIVYDICIPQIAYSVLNLAVPLMGKKCYGMVECGAGLGKGRLVRPYSGLISGQIIILPGLEECVILWSILHKHHPGIEIPVFP